MSTQGLDEFAGWVEGLMRARGYDIDSPRGGGKSRIADEAGVHRAAVTRLLQRQSMPDLETMRRIAPLLGVSVRDMLIRSGRVTPEELPLAEDLLAPGDWQPTMEDFARWLGVPDERMDVFVKVVTQFLEPDAEGADARGTAESRRAAQD
ncbi:helix-turn-helix domain-containing protein [Streptomyces showdoensis]|uniref:DNA-binding protein n=1 Tax=Streptomyces showdoensis TaxID=68268 RepID=A0A2P2GNG1_STREW|nr:helix-turn-helix transcriptional regulator [Streptomyces showdoensis]KKZ73037.1 DNA-binding protein [Streptomyces showdoensis]